MKILKDQKGQGALEYLLMIAAALAIVAIVAWYLRGYAQRGGNLSTQKLNASLRNISRI
ncbi:MAG: class III signal peptide-containing protein [Euryarchaeota archaeon]|nr:class III signal peptide-containing protein [Euryarchaeota archaeon]